MAAHDAIPTTPASWNDLGIDLVRRGLAAEAVEAYGRACALAAGAGGFPAAESNRLVAMTFTMLPSPAAVAAEFAAWARRWARPLYEAHGPPPYANVRDPGRRLRIGYPSPDFRQHASATFLELILEGHDREQVEVVCYSDVSREDRVTRRFRRLAGLWRETADLSDVALARLILSDRIDVLVDTTGHMARNRLPVFARRAAPVQVAHASYPGGTGMAWAFDALVADHDRYPVGAEALYAEPLVRLSVPSVCYRPPDGAVEVAPRAPCVAAGHVTFGCLNQLVKVTPETMRLWARILAAVPMSRLTVLVEAPDGERRLNDEVRDRFAAHGVPVDRLDLVPRMARQTYLETFNRIDIALDPMPFNGHTTTFDATWMAVPTVTLPGEMNVSRVGLSILKHVGLEHLAAATEDEYVRAAVALANDRAELARLRRELRGRLAASPLCDGRRVAAGLEGVYRELWGRWVGTGGH